MVALVLFTLWFFDLHNQKVIFYEDLPQGNLWLHLHLLMYVPSRFMTGAMTDKTAYV